MAWASRQSAVKYRTPLLTFWWRLVFRREICDVGGEDGFTLVEVIVALAIVSAGLGLAFTLTSIGLGRVSSAQRMAGANSLAQSLVAQIGNEFAIKADEREGSELGGYRWHVSLRPYGDIRDAAENSVALYSVTTEVEWNDHDARRSYRLSTLRLGPAGQQR